MNTNTLIRGSLAAILLGSAAVLFHPTTSTAPPAPVPVQHVDSEKQKCEADGEHKWTKKLWPFDGYFCMSTKPLPYDCHWAAIKISSAHTVWKEYFDEAWKTTWARPKEQGLAGLPEELERPEKEKWANYKKDRAWEEVRKAAQEYMAHPECQEPDRKENDHDMQLIREWAK